MPSAPQRPPPALRGIALFEAVKGLLALAAAAGIISLRHTDLNAATVAFLLRHGIALSATSSGCLSNRWPGPQIIARA